MSTILSLFELEDYWEKMKQRVVSIEIILYIVFYLVYVLQMPFRSILGISLSFNLSLLPLALFLISCASWPQLLVPREWELLKIHVLFQEGKQYFSLKKKLHACSLMFRLIIWRLESSKKQDQFCGYYRDSYSGQHCIGTNFKHL